MPSSAIEELETRVKNIVHHPLQVQEMDDSSSVDALLVGSIIENTFENQEIQAAQSRDFDLNPSRSSQKYTWGLIPSWYMDDDNEESFSRPAKRRRISHRGSPDAFPGPFRNGSGLSPIRYENEVVSMLSTSSMRYGAGGGSSQTNEHPNEVEEVDIVETSDNEEILLEDNYNDHDDYATTTFARTSPRTVSSAPTSSPYHESRFPITSELDQNEVSVIPNNSTSSVSNIFSVCVLSHSTPYLDKPGYRQY